MQTKFIFINKPTVQFLDKKTNFSTTPEEGELNFRHLTLIWHKEHCLYNTKH